MVLPSQQLLTAHVTRGVSLLYFPHSCLYRLFAVLVFVKMIGSSLSWSAAFFKHGSVVCPALVKVIIDVIGECSCLLRRRAIAAC